MNKDVYILTRALSVRLYVPISAGTAKRTAMCRANYSATSNNMKLIHWPLTGTWSATFGTARRGLGGAAARSGPSSLYQIAVHPSTASVTITVLLYSYPLLCGFNMPHI